MGDVLLTLLGLFIVAGIVVVAIGATTERHRVETQRKLDQRLEMMREAELTRRAYKARFGLD